MDLTVFVFADTYGKALEWILEHAAWYAPSFRVKPFATSSDLVAQRDYIAIVLPSFYIRPDARPTMGTVREQAGLVVKI